MGKVSLLHEAGSLSMPLADGSTLRVTPFHESPSVAVTLHGPNGGDAGGVLLTAKRARLLASWLLRVADECGNTVVHPGSARPGSAKPGSTRIGRVRPALPSRRD
ncbi:MAG TPA: hypothetical protein VEM57_01815 [Candidatus Binatus sp.]|nr:hypothetical protein [Candidatus Binatus sp.]